MLSVAATAAALNTESATAAAVRNAVLNMSFSVERKECEPRSWGLRPGGIMRHPSRAAMGASIAQGGSACPAPSLGFEADLFHERRISREFLTERRLGMLGRADGDGIALL